MEAWYSPLLHLPGLDLLMIALLLLALMGWLLGFLVALFFSLSQRCRMNGSPPWWALLTFGLAVLVLVLRQFSNGAMVVEGEAGKYLGFAVIGLLSILYAIRRGDAVGFRLFGEYGDAGLARGAAPPSRLPGMLLLLQILFWSLVLWGLSRLFPHAQGRQLLLVVLLVFAGGFPYAVRIGLLDWSLKSEGERDCSRGNRFLFGAVLLMVAGLIVHPLLLPNRLEYLLGGGLCLIIGIAYRNAGQAVQRYPTEVTAPAGTSFPVFQSVEAPDRRALIADLDELQQPAMPAVEAEALPDYAQGYEEDNAPSRPRFGPLISLAGFVLLAYAVHLWQNYLAHDGFGGVVSLILGVFNSVLTLLGIILFFSGFRQRSR